MIERPVVLVLGAGASEPYGFPLADDLKKTAIEGRGSLHEKFEWLHPNAGQVIDDFLWKLRGSKCGSIDAFVENRAEFLDVGKALIAYYLIRCEQEAGLYASGIKGDWYQYLFEMMLSDGFDSFTENKLSVVTYNYDRSFEYCLFEALRSRYGRDPTECADKVRSIPIIHVHGKLGALPELDGEGRHYEEKTDEPYLRLAIKGIRIVSEPIDDDPVFADAHAVLKQAEIVIFLGFGYLPENIERLQLNEHRNERTVYYGTAVGLTESECEETQALFPRRTITEGLLPRIRLDPEAQSRNVREFIRNHLDLFRR